MKRALVVCPGRGSYDRTSLGWLKGREELPVVRACDGWRADLGRPTVTAMDGAEGYQSKLHVAGENASILTFACTMADLASLSADRFEVAGVVGNSMGFYTALAASGALPIPEAIRLVDTMGAYQEDHVVGGQIMYPYEPGAERTVEDAITSAWEAGGKAYWSIRLGGYAVLGADEAGLAHLQQALPKVDRGSRSFPARLPLHSAFHTPLLTETSLRAKQDLHDLGFRAPSVPLVDGRGVVFRPRWASPADLWEYTLGHQVVEPYDFATSVITALRHVGPDVVVALGPGNPLGGPLVGLLVREGWNGLRTRADFDARQAEDPILLSFGVSKQREWLI